MTNPKIFILTRTHYIRVEIKKAIPGIGNRRRVLRYYDERCEELQKYIDSQWFLFLPPVLKHAFNKMWDMNDYIIARWDMSPKSIRCYNTASMFISDGILRPFKAKYLKEK